MRWTGLTLLLVCFARLSGGQTTSRPAEAPPAFPSDALRHLVPGEHNQAGATITMDESTGGWRVAVETPVSEAWNAQLLARSVGRLSEGEVLVVEAELTVQATDPDTEEAKVQIVLQRTAAPFASSDEAVFFLSPGEQRIVAPLKLKWPAEAGQMHIAINFGFGRQTVNLRGITIRNEGSADPTGLRSPAPTYGGRAADASWRQAAQERIERMRKSNLRVRVTDSSGRPIEGAEVRVRLDRHDFAFGTAVVGSRIVGDKPDDERYRAILQGHFNAAVFESDMKWVRWEAGKPEDRARHRERTIAAVRWLTSNGLRVRGHCLVWPGYGTERWRYLPDDIRPMVNARDVEGLRRRIAAHVEDVAGAFRGMLIEWDVVNEPVFNRVLQDVLGEQAVGDWFEQARRADPAAARYLNDFTMLSYGAINRGNRRAFFENVRKLQTAGAPIDGIGEQAHFDSTLIGIGELLKTLDEFGSLGLPIRITEFDINADDPQLQADYLRDFYTAAFSHPSVNGIVMWGFWQKHHWKPKAALWADDWTLRPHGRAYCDLVGKVWNTDVRGRTDRAGRFEARGFRGQYTVFVNAGGGMTERQVHLGDRDVDLSVSVPSE